jgi:hypothetical protein
VGALSWSEEGRQQQCRRLLSSGTRPERRWSGKEEVMLFMTVYSYPPAHRNEVIQRRATKGPQLPDGVKALGEWSYLGSGKVFRLVEAADAAEVYKAVYAWSDLGTVETYPVLEVEQIMGMLSAAHR